MINIDMIPDLDTSSTMANYSNNATLRLTLLRKVPMTDIERDLITGLEPLMTSVLEFPCPIEIANVFCANEDSSTSLIHEIAIYCQAVAHLKVTSITSSFSRYRNAQIDAGVRIYLDEVQRLMTTIVGNNPTFWTKYHRRTQAYRSGTDQSLLKDGQFDTNEIISVARSFNSVLLVPLDVIHEISSHHHLKYEEIKQVISMVQHAHVLSRTGMNVSSINTIMSGAIRMASHLEISELNSWVTSSLKSLNNPIS